MKELFTWVDALFSMNPNMLSHTGGAMSMGYRMINCCSSKQKLNKKSSTKLYFVGSCEYVPFNIWMVMFYEAQGYDITKNVLFQDNEITIKMEKNVQESCKGNSRHINIGRFFMKDRVDKE